MPKFRVSFDVEADKIEDVEQFIYNEVSPTVAEYYGMRLWTPVISPWVVIED